MAVFTLFPKDGDVVSPCSSILVATNRQKCKSGDSSALKVFGPHCVSRLLVATRSSLISVIVDHRIPRRARRCNKRRPQGSFALPKAWGKM